MGKSTTNWTREETGAIREQLQRILQSDLFTQSERHTRFLRFIVEETLAGNADRLNGFLLGIEVFDRDESFDPAVDSIVRVEAGRLRSKLREYYTGDGRADPVEIVLPKGGYTVRFNFKTEYVSDSLVRVDAGTEPPEEHHTIAVLPFDNLSTNSEQEYFSDGITEDIITDLSRISGLYVIARHSTFAYKGKPAKTSEISAELGARYIIEGSVRKSGDRVRISSQLIDTKTDRHLWADRFDRDLHDVFAIQEEVSRKIVAALKVKLTSQEDAHLARRGTGNIEAHDYLLRGLEQYYRFTPEAVHKAIEFLSMAIELDPGYAEAHAWKSRIVIYDYATGMNTVVEETVKPATALARKAVELDEYLPLGHAVLGWVLMWDRQIDEALSAVNRAVELNPNFADALLWQSLVLSSAGRGQEGLAAIEKAIDLNPHYIITYTFALGIAWFALGQYEKALTHFERGVRRNPDFMPNHLFITCINGLLGRREEAMEAKEKLLELNPDYTTAITSIFNDNQIKDQFRKGMNAAGIA